MSNKISVHCDCSAYEICNMLSLHFDHKIHNTLCDAFDLCGVLFPDDQGTKPKECSVWGCGQLAQQSFFPRIPSCAQRSLKFLLKCQGAELWCQEDGIGEVQERMCGRETVRQWGMQLGGSISCTEPAWEIAIELSAAHPPPSHLINCTPPHPTFRARCT